jgi:hypothetical protein
MWLCLAVAGVWALVAARSPLAAEERLAPRRFPQNPLITVNSSATLGGNVNGPTVIRVPAWVEHPLGRYYMYFANHMGDFIRLAYADSVTGPWRVYEPGVLHVRDTAFYRPQPDPVETRADFYTHVASPEILVDPGARQIVMWVHGWWTEDEGWPVQPAEARAWARSKGYGQYTQPALSGDGLHFTVQPAITRTSYLRVFARDRAFYGVSRLGLVSRAPERLGTFEPGPNLFRETVYATRVRHVGLAFRNSRMYVFFTAIGDAPERILVSTVDLSADWRSWKASPPLDVLSPEAPYECTDVPNAPSEAGDIDHPARQIRDPFVFEDGGKTFLFYSTCGEQGIAAAEISLP